MAERAQKDRPGGQDALHRSGTLGRMFALKVGLLLLFAVIACRLVQIQVLEARRYQEVARRQSEVKVVLPAARGNIYDRNGALLVSNAIMASLGADPKMMGTDANEFAARLARVFEHTRRYYLDKLDTERRFVYLERRVKPQLVRMVNPAAFDGIVQLEEPRRLYHYEQLAGQVIGFTDVDNNGLSGVELQCNSALQGRDGFMIMQRDALGRRRTSVDYPRTEPANGRHVTLTLDLGFQAIAEEELRKGIERTTAESGLVVMIDPATGEVLAMANYPGINPNDPGHGDAGPAKNRAITDMFEPGSVFKVVTASAALEHHLVAPGQKFFGEQGVWVVGTGGKSRRITDTHPHGMLSMQEAVEQSSNIVMAKISNLIGAELLYTTARDFGFGNESGIDLPGEVRGELKKPTAWSGTTLNSMAYGYEVGVTPIQIASAYATIANKGVLMKPYVIKRVLDDQEQVLSETRPQAIRTVVSRETARTLTTFLEGVVEHGTGTGARLDGVAVAGKTGTSRKFIGDRYEPGKIYGVVRGVLSFRGSESRLPGDAGQPARGRLHRRRGQRPDLPGHRPEGVCDLGSLCPCRGRAGGPLPGGARCDHADRRCGQGHPHRTRICGDDSGDGCHGRPPAARARGASGAGRRRRADRGRRRGDGRTGRLYSRARRARAFPPPCHEQTRLGTARRRDQRLGAGQRPGSGRRHPGEDRLPHCRSLRAEGYSGRCELTVRPAV